MEPERRLEPGRPTLALAAVGDGPGAGPAPARRPRGQPSHMRPEDRRALADLILAHPRARDTEVARLYFERTGKDVRPQTVGQHRRKLVAAAEAPLHWESGKYGSVVARRDGLVIEMEDISGDMVEPNWMAFIKREGGGDVLAGSDFVHVFAANRAAIEVLIRFIVREAQRKTPVAGRPGAPAGSP